MTSLLILIYFYLGFTWAEQVLYKRLSFPMFIANILCWPLFLLISTVSYLKVKPNNVIKEKS